MKGWFSFLRSHVVSAGKRVRARKGCKSDYMEKEYYGELNMVKWGLIRGRCETRHACSECYMTDTIIL